MDGQQADAVVVRVDVTPLLRGETARTLLYVSPVLAWAAGGDIAAEPARPAGYRALLLAWMVIQTLVFQAVLIVYH